MKRTAFTTTAVAPALVLLFAALLTGCGPAADVTTETSTVTTVPVTAVTGSSATTEEPPSTTTAENSPSERIEYALSLGGVSREGDTLFFVVGAETASEEEAQALLQEAIPVFGDMQSYFIVQKSDNFKGMAPGQWVVIEAFEANPTAENVEFGRRAFPSAYVVQAKVLTAEPIPVYEDRLGL
jgi:hypothetical protein